MKSQTAPCVLVQFCKSEMTLSYNLFRFIYHYFIPDNWSYQLSNFSLSMSWQIQRRRVSIYGKHLRTTPPIKVRAYAVKMHADLKKNRIRAWWAPYNSWRTIEECGVKIDIFSLSVRNFFGMKFKKKNLATIEEWNLAWNFCIITHFLKLIMLYGIPNLFWE